MSKIKLYGFDMCGECQQVKGVLSGMGLDYDYIKIDPDNREIVKKVSDQPYVPVLVDEEEIITDLEDILEHLKLKY